MLGKLLTLLFILFTGINKNTYAQQLNLNVEEWAKKLASPSDKQNETYHTLDTTLEHADSITTFKFLNELEKQTEAKGNYFYARFNCLKARKLRYYHVSTPPFYPFNSETFEGRVTALLKSAMQAAYASGDDYLAALISSEYGDAMAFYQNSEFAIMYMMNSAELYEKLHLAAHYRTNLVLGEMLWRIREYKKSIKYSKEAINGLLKSKDPKKVAWIMMCNNTIGLAYHRMGNFDSAFKYYNKGLVLSHKIYDSVFTGVISGNMAQIYFVQDRFNVALPLFETDYQVSKRNHIYDNAANSLQWAARTNLKLGNKETALQQLREAFLLLQKYPSANYLQNAYSTASEVFKSLGDDDSAYYYSIKYNLLHDSIEKTIFASSISIANLRIKNEKNRYDILNLEREKSEQLRQRNLVILAIVLFSAVVLLLINRKRQELKHSGDIMLQQKKTIEVEMEAAREQLEAFRENIIEKSSLIEKLQAQTQKKERTAEEHKLIEDLCHQSILTEEDWIKFKTLFGKIYPDFIDQVSKKAENITQAEQRMAALTRLHLTTKQMAAVLGISPNSVNKAKQRLRHRFNLDTGQQVESFLENL